MGSDLAIRPAKLPDDARAISLFVRAEADGLNIPDKLALARADEFLMSAQVPWDLFLVAHQGGALVGFLILTTGRKHSDEHTAQLRIYLSADARGGGIGSALMEEALRWADQRGVERIIATPYVGYEVVHGEVGDFYFEEETQLLDSLSRRKLAFFERFDFRLEGFMTRAAKLRDGGLTDVAMMGRVAA